MRILFKNRRLGFSLVEVIIGLALAALVLGLVLRSVAQQTMAVSHAVDRYQSFVEASQTLEQRMEEGVTEPEAKKSSELSGEKSGDHADQRVPFDYELTTQPVTADPRFELISVRVALPNVGYATVAAYRLKIRRPRAAASPGASPGASPTASGSTPTPGTAATQAPPPPATGGGKPGAP